MSSQEVKALAVLRQLASTKPSGTVHTVYDGFNAGARLAGIDDPVKLVDGLIKAGKLYGRGCKGGYLVSFSPIISPVGRKVSAVVAMFENPPEAAPVLRK